MTSSWITQPPTNLCFSFTNSDFRCENAPCIFCSCIHVIGECIKKAEHVMKTNEPNSSKQINMYFTKKNPVDNKPFVCFLIVIFHTDVTILTDGIGFNLSWHGGSFRNRGLIIPWVGLAGQRKWPWKTRFSLLGRSHGNLDICKCINTHYGFCFVYPS